jgi:dCMP deaminase
VGRKVDALDRKPWDEFFIDMAELWATRSTCLRRHVGAVIVKDKRILSTGYNGATAGKPHCDKIGCYRQINNIPSGERYELCRGAHAEQNAINNAALNGIAINGATMYCTDYPCPMCAKSITNSGIKKVVYTRGTIDIMAVDILSNIEVVHYEPGKQI